MFANGATFFSTTYFADNIYLSGKTYIGDLPDDLGSGYCCAISYLASDGTLVIRPYLNWMDCRLGTNNEPFSYVRSKNFNTISDRKQKKHVSYLRDDYSICENFIYNLAPSVYSMKADKNGPLHFGFYAQDIASLLYEVLPDSDFEVVSAERIGDDKRLSIKEAQAISDEELSWTLSYDELIAPLVTVVQNQKKQLDEMNARLSALENQ
jgi:hypothetical protein